MCAARDIGSGETRTADQQAASCSEVLATLGQISARRLALVQAPRPEGQGARGPGFSRTRGLRTELHAQRLPPGCPSRGNLSETWCALQLRRSQLGPGAASP